MVHVEPEHSRSAVGRASKAIGKGKGTPEELTEARAVLANFRSAHAYPLNAVTVTVRQKALEVNANAVVAQRLKRLPTILDKLKRIPTMSVTTMHDLGGCRVVFSSVGEVDALVEELIELPRARNRVLRTYDYLRADPENEHAGPKPSGYRGMHLAYEYRASKEVYHGLRIELQVRTQLQHAWATAVETMDLFSGSELKYSKGDPQVIRFFVLVSSLMALEEGVSPVPGADAPKAELVDEVALLESEVGIIDRLEGYAAIVGDHATSDRRNALTLELRRSAGTLEVRVHEKQSDAEARLAELEALDDDDLDVVLVNIARISQLQAAYPNYYADTSMFTEFVKRLIL
ncbi:RelA/SpoT domain-containing protein [Microbacterium caowuchunii]|uniref:RelA/SpoT domain-containing protein n=1 Tax=Microbacterium caowuchunii TaxID=2614638 RepID=A0A5N0TI88_9MICO|nr:RelA/SpoT domain-containing protein [Microbacterium caowuchunii]KAA9134835.1 RelA/SpoT domain-containing protein [Microbacterium caowuchunii]